MPTAELPKELSLISLARMRRNAIAALLQLKLIHAERSDISMLFKPNRCTRHQHA
jgi:hypothetical protein